MGPALAGGPGVVEGDARERALRGWSGAVRCECGPVVWDRSAWGRLGLGGSGPCGGGGEAGRAQVKEGSGPRKESGRAGFGLG